MATLTRRFGAAALLGVAAGLLTAPSVFAQAQPSRPNPQVPFYRPAGFFGRGPAPAMALNSSANLINPRFQYTPNYPINQLAYNTAVFGRAVSNIPPWLYGYNPYPPVNFGPSFPSIYGGYPSMPYGASLTSTPYGGGYSSLYSNTPGGGALGGGGSPGYDSSYYSNPYASYYDPYGGGLRGAAEAIGAQGRFEIDFQKARLLNQEVERSKLDTRRKIFDEWLYERANTPTLNDIQERQTKFERSRALLGMPLSEVLNAHALNVLLDDLAKRGNWSAKDPYGPIDPDILKQVNVTSGTGNVGLFKNLKDGTPLTWPLPLQGLAYQDEVRRLNQKAAEAIKLVQSTGQADAATLNDMKKDIAMLRGKLSGHVNDLTPSQYAEALRFLNQFNEAVRGLEQPDVANYFTDKFAVKAKTVPELVQHMQKHGLKFAPAVGGDEAAYSALYNYLVGYALQSGAGSASAATKE
jgi:hypothetical protein